MGLIEARKRKIRSFSILDLRSQDVLDKTDNDTDLSHFFLLSLTTAWAFNFQSSTRNSDIFQIQKHLKYEQYRLYRSTEINYTTRTKKNDTQV